MARKDVVTELTEMAIKATEGRGELDGLLLKWSGKVRLDSWINRKTLCREDAQDLKQEVLINIYKGLMMDEGKKYGRFDPEKSNFETWAFNRARQIIRSWIRTRIRESRPLAIKGYKGRESIRGQVIQMPEGYDAPVTKSYNNPVYSELNDSCDILVQGINDNLDVMKMQDRKREPTKNTLGFLKDGKTIPEIAETLQTSRGQVRAHIGRIRKATLLALEEDLVLA